jgi:uncharacterized protein (UPF0218 family)
MSKIEPDYSASAPQITVNSHEDLFTINHILACNASHTVMHGKASHKVMHPKWDQEGKV